MEKEPKNDLEYSIAVEGKKDAEAALEEIRKEITDFSAELLKVQSELLDYRKLKEEIEALSKEPQDQDYLIKTLQESIEFLENQIDSFKTEEIRMKKYIERFEDLDQKLKDVLLKSKTTKSTN